VENIQNYCGETFTFSVSVQSHVCVCVCVCVCMYLSVYYNIAISYRIEINLIHPRKAVFVQCVGRSIDFSGVISCQSVFVCLMEYFTVCVLWMNNRS
jgi:hypothetical protein